MNDQVTKAYVEGVRGSPELLEFTKLQFDRGASYYSARIARLGLKGDRVLDAGCGVGNWSLGLRSFFRQVHSLELRQDRLGVLSGLRRQFSITDVHPSLGSIESLPFADHSFDTVFCNGVISLSRVGTALREFKRVLKPNGYLYLSYNSTDWWTHLILDRRTSDTIRFGCEAFLNRAVRLLARRQAVDLGYLLACLDLELSRLAWCRSALEPAADRFPRSLTKVHVKETIRLWSEEVKKAAAKIGILVTLWKTSRGNLDATPSTRLSWLRLAGAVAKSFMIRRKLACLRLLQEELANRLGRQPGTELEAELNRRIGTTLASPDPSRSFSLYDLSCCIGNVRAFGTDQQQLLLWKELVARIAGGRSDFVPETQIHALQPGEMVELLEELGFQEVGTSWEGTLLLDPSAPDVRPIYECNQGVYEVLAQRMDGLGQDDRWSALEFFPNNARRAPAVYGFFRGPDAVISNKKVRRASEHSARTLIGATIQKVSRQDLVQKVLGEISREATTEEAAFSRMYRFIQDSLFHHPCVQLVKENGSIEDDLRVILFSGIGRCGHVALLTAELFQALGYKTRVTQLYKHVCAEVFDGFNWRLVDADMWKAGVFPGGGQGRWLSLSDLKQTPSKIDELPSIGLMLSKDGPWMKNFFGEECQGYVDAGLAWERPYPSYLYFGGAHFGGKQRSPAQPPRLEARFVQEQLEIVAQGISSSTHTLRLFVDPISRGWSYQDYPDQRFLCHPKGALWCRDYLPSELEKGVKIPVSMKPLYINACALDSYMMENPIVYKWPGEELVIGN